MENWKDVVGYEQYFKVSDTGKVYSKRTSKILSQTISQTGYYTIATKIGGRKGKALCFKVHRLVAQAFINNTENKPFVNHKDGNKLNNLCENLEWSTALENIRHAFATGLACGLSGEDSPNSKLNYSIVDQIRFEYITTKISQRKLAQKYGVSKTTIQNILANERWTSSV